MPIHPVLRPGAEAFLRGDFTAARRAWTRVQGELASELGDLEQDLLESLSRLAGSLEEQRRDRPEAARRQYATAREDLASLPTGVLGVHPARLVRNLPEEVSAAAAAPPRVPAAPRVPLAVVLRALVLVVLLAIGIVAVRWTPLGDLLEREALAAMLADLRDRWWAPLALIALYLVLSPLGVPATPMIFAGGFVFGIGVGGFNNFVGTFLGAATTYLLGRLLGRDLVIHLAGPRLRRVETHLRRQGFWTLTRMRLLPVPFPLVNYGAALAGVRPGKFLASSALGLAPAVFLLTWFASVLAHAAANPGESEVRGTLVQLVLAFAGVLAVTFLPQLWQARRRRRRYHAILARRLRRGSGTGDTDTG